MLAKTTEKQVSVLFLEILLLSAQGFAANDSFQSGLEDAGRQYACPGEVVNYTCTVVDPNAPILSLTIWRGTALDCPPSNTISLGHSLYNTTGTSGTCTNGAITAESVGVVNNCFTSRLIVTASSGLNETTVECTLSGVRVVGSRTILIAGPPAAPGTPIVFFPTPEVVFNITWTNPLPNMNEMIDTYFVNISGPNNKDLCGTGNTLQNVTERNYICTRQTTPLEGERYTITVAAANCDGRLRGPESAPAILQVPYAPTSITFGPDCPDLQFVDVFWQNPTRNSMIMPEVSDVCVMYCTGDNCTSSDCVSVSGNNPFRINNTVNGTSYNISVSLRNDFGESRQTTALYDMMECPTGTTATTPSSTTPTTTGSSSSNMPVGSSLGPPIGGAVGGICVLLLILIDVLLCEMWLKRQSDESTCVRIVLVVLLFVTVFGIPIAIAMLIYEHCCKSEKCDTEKVSTCCWIIIIAVLLLTFVGIPFAIALLLHHRYKTMQVSTFVAVLFMFLSVFGIPLAIAVIIYECCCKSEKEKKDEDVELRGSSPDKSSPPAEATDSAPAPLLYADPSTIPREEHPTTGDVYSMPDKSRKTQKPEDHLPTYQDPGAISHEAAPTGELYTVPDKKKGAKKKKPQASRPSEEQLAEMYSQPDKSRKQQSQGLNYADVGFNAPSSGKVPEKPPQVFYADVKNV